MTGSWRPYRLSWTQFIQYQCKVMEWISSVGSYLHKNGILLQRISAYWSFEFPWKSIWKPRVPTRVAFFLWTATLGRILTVDNLRKKNTIGDLVLYVQKGWGDS